MRYYRAQLKHDKGQATITLNASDEQAAITSIMKAEKCLRRSIIKIDEVELLQGEWVNVLKCEPVDYIEEECIRGDLERK